MENYSVQETKSAHYSPVRLYTEMPHKQRGKYGCRMQRLEELSPSQRLGHCEAGVLRLHSKHLQKI